MMAQAGAVDVVVGEEGETDLAAVLADAGACHPASTDDHLEDFGHHAPFGFLNSRAIPSPSRGAQVSRSRQAGQVTVLRQPENRRGEPWVAGAPQATLDRPSTFSRSR